MNTSDLDPINRKILVIVTDNEKYLLPVEPDGRELLSQPHVAVISDSDFDDEGYYLIGGDGYVQSGMVLLISPFNDEKYMNLHGARQTAAIEKMHATTRLCQLLGARSVALERLEIIDRESNESLLWDAEVMGVAGELTTRINDMHKLRSSLQLQVEFSGSSANNEMAKDFFYHSHLASDSSLQSIYEMRLDENPLSKIKLEISLSESINSSISLLASLNLPDIFTKLNLQSLLRSRTSVEKIVKEDIEISSRIHVTF